MGYEPIYSEPADEQFNQLSPLLQKVFLDNIEKLADDPISACNSPTSNLWPAHQLYQFECHDGDKVHVFNVVWRYGEDENHIKILAFAVNAYG
jgi:hypothetical protein